MEKGGYEFLATTRIIEFNLRNKILSDVQVRELVITKVPFLDELLYPTTANQWSVAVGVRGLFFRCHKLSHLSHKDRPVLAPTEN